MEKINLTEVSVVDHPAHMREGFAVIKSADTNRNRALFGALRKDTMPTKEEIAEVLKSLSADDLRAALTDEQVAALAPAPVEKADKEPTEDDILKALPDNVRGLIEKAQADIEKARAEAAEAKAEAEIEKAARLDEAAIQKSKDDYTNLAFAHETVAPALRKFAAADQEAHDAIVTMLKAVNAQADGAIFEEIGTSAPVTKADSPEAQLQALAKARAAEKDEPIHKALAEVLADPANQALVTKHFEQEN